MNIVQQHQIDFKLFDRPDIPTRRYKAGETVMSEGEPAKEMFVVRSGKVAVQVHGKTVEEVGAGGLFGEMALIDHAPRSASVVAVEDSELVPINERLFVVLVQDTPFFALDVMRVLVERIRHMNAQA
ncbi:MAG: cyclic nucleotide-binding domain-containing protein [Bauldia sp.]|nr:cyclic nucleotide-binding domain-containing protein [Bauldia sp.]